MPLFAFFEGATQAGLVPGVLIGVEQRRGVGRGGLVLFDGILGPEVPMSGVGELFEVPGIVGEFALGILSAVLVGGHACGGDGDSVVVEGEGRIADEVFGGFDLAGFFVDGIGADAIEQVSVGAIEFDFAALAEGVMPDDPVAKEQLAIALEIF